MKVTVLTVFLYPFSLSPIRDAGSSGQLYDGKAVVLSHCNDSREKTTRKGKKKKKKSLFYLKDGEYVPLYQW